MTSFQNGTYIVPPPFGLKYFDVQVFNGVWISLNDQLNFRIAGGTFEGAQQSRKRYIVSSSMYDGEWEVHSTATNVTEIIVVDVLGSNQNEVTENMLAIEEAFSQRSYNVKVIMDNHQETWTCFPAEWSKDRGRIRAHNIQMQMRLNIPRFTKVTYEVIQ